MLRVRRWAFVGLMRLRVATDLRRCAVIAGSGTRRRASGAISLDTIKLRMEQTHSSPERLVARMREEEPPQDLETKMRCEHAATRKAVEEMTKPKTLDEMLDQYDEEMAED
jgi:hypothetical protein